MSANTINRLPADPTTERDIDELFAKAVKRPDPTKRPATQKDLDAVLHAVGDTLDGVLAEGHAEVADYVEAQLQAFEQHVLGKFGDMLDERVEQIMAAIDRRLDRFVTGTAANVVEDLGEFIGERMSAFRDESKAEAASLRRSLSEHKTKYAEDMDNLDRVYSSCLRALETRMVKTIAPEVIVNVPQQPAPQLVLPADAIQVNVEPQIVVQPPQRTVTKKVIEYDNGRPSSIVETTE